MINNEHGSFIIGIPIEELEKGAERISVEQLRHLVRLVDASDTVELEVRQGDQKTRLVLRKARPSESAVAQIEALPIVEAEAHIEAGEALHTITAPFVGLFQPWSTSQDRPLVTVGDSVEKGQHVGVIRSMGIPNEVESPARGQVVEVLVRDGQPVEYGQPLMTIAKQ